jgi:hypothetical protein
MLSSTGYPRLVKAQAERERKNILDVDKFVVNRLAPKCIQRHGLNRISHSRRLNPS